MLLWTAWILVSGCSNNPYPRHDASGNVHYGSISEDPKSLDPTFAYDSLSLSIIGSIYDAPLQYSYLKRPYQVEPSLAAKMPEKIEADDADLEREVDGGALTHEERLGSSASRPSAHGYRIEIKKGLRFQDDACFEETHGRGREVKSDDFLFALKRIADPTVICPVRSILGEKIVGLNEFFHENKKLIKKRKEQGQRPCADFSMPVKGLRRIGDYTFEVYLTEPYPQFLYWLAMPFTAPIPHEAVEYYDSRNNPDRRDFKDHPVGTGAYRLKEYRKGHRMVLERNPNFREEVFPSEGDPGDREAGMLADAGKRLPFVDEWVLTVVKESIPRWNLFRQGYMDGSGVPREAFDRVITPEGDLSEAMKQRDIRLHRAKRLLTYYYAFNMDDPVVGANRKLRQAISHAINTAEYLELYQNGLGTVAHSPIPPGMFGYDAEYRNRYRQYDLKKAKALLAEAGYEGGIDPKTGEPLVISYDTSANDASGRQATRWLVKQFENLHLSLRVVVNDWNTHQQKADDGNFQIILFGWIADYPDPENFLFLLHSENRRPGVNYANYSNRDYDGLFDQMKSMSCIGEEGQRRQGIVRKMIDILEEDCPWVPSLHPESYSLEHTWMGNVKLHGPGHNLRKYRRLDPQLRTQLRKEWNRPNYAVICTLLGLVVLGALPAFWMVRRWRP